MSFSVAAKQTAAPKALRVNSNRSVQASLLTPSHPVAGLVAKSAVLARGPLRASKILRVSATATPEAARSDTGAGEEPAYAGTFVTERDRRAAAKGSLIAVLPDQPLSTSYSSAVKEAVGERLLVLEHLCPISDPARQSLDGTWEVLYMNTITPGLVAAQVLQSLPGATLEKIVLNISGGEVKATAKVSLFDATTMDVDLVSTWSAESEIRVREVYQKGSISLPELGTAAWTEAALETANKSAPTQVVGMLTQAVTNAAPMLQSFGQGFEVPAQGAYERVTLISYLDEDLMVARSLSGTPEILRRLPDPPPAETEMTLEQEDVEVVDQEEITFDFGSMELDEPAGPSPPEPMTAAKGEEATEDELRM